MAATRSSAEAQAVEANTPATVARSTVRPRPSSSGAPATPSAGGDLAPPGQQRTISGSVRPGRRTKLLVKHLVRGDIALIDHLDIDRVSAEELIAAGAVAVLNCRPSSSGSYPNLGPQLLVEAGILLVDLPDDALFDTLSDGDPASVRVALARPATADQSCDVLRKGKVLARGEVLDLERIAAETELRRREIGEALERFASNTIEHMREERELLSGRIRLP